MTATLTHSLKTLAIAIMMLFPTVLLGQKYTTLTDGNWNNTTTVWSLDGATPCACTPGATVDNVVVQINHAIEMSYNVVVQNNGTINVTANNSLSGLSYLINNLSGFVNVYGELVLQHIDVQSGTDLYVSGILTIIDGDLNDFGYLTLDGATVGITNGNLVVQTGALASFLNSTFVSVLDGNIDNLGDIFFDNSCASATNGNFMNAPAGAIIGNGAVNVTGDIINQNVWMSSVDWCADGAGVGLGHAENCEANACGGFLPVEYEFILGTVQADATVLVEWKTSEETNNQQFNVQRSVDGQSYETIGTVYPEADMRYEFVDQQAPQGNVHYRLEQVDQEGAKNFSEIVTVKVDGFQEAFAAYPNPFGEALTLSFQGESGSSATFTIHDLSGRMVHQDKIELQHYAQQKQIQTSNLSAGLYVLSVNQGTIKYRVKLTKN